MDVNDNEVKLKGYGQSYAKRVQSRTEFSWSAENFECFFIVRIKFFEQKLCCIKINLLSAHCTLISG